VVGGASGFPALEEVVVSPQHVTLEPNEANSDGTALTLYFVGDVPAKVVEGLLKAGPPSVGGLSVDVSDPFFNVVRTGLQPFPGYSRFQAHPTG
jgi:hypothetical protein